MPKRPPTYCRQHGCGALMDKPGYCDKHRKESNTWTRWQKGKGNRHERGYDYVWVNKTRPRIKARDKGLCQEHLRNGFLVVGSICDHITPKAHGGSDSDDNLQWLCATCHKKKTARERRGAVKS